MNVLLVNQFFWPDTAATSQFLTDLARHLTSQGHSVTVICSRNLYARPDESGTPPAARIVRLAGPPFTRGPVGRLASYTAFFCGALWTALRRPETDIVLTLTTPPLISIVGMLTKRFRGARHFIWEMDLFPEALTDVGQLAPNSWATRAIGAISDFVRLRSDGVIALGECMRDRLLARGLPPSLIHIAENWADGTLIAATPARRSERLRVLYSGNLGLAHDIETIGQAIVACNDDCRFHFTFAGGGARRTELEELCRQHGVSNVEFRPYSDRGSFGESLASGDVGLVTQRSCCLGTVVPSKVYGLLAAGRPLLFIGPREATPARIIDKFGCGWHIRCGDVTGLVELLRLLQEQPARVHVAGERAREAFEAHYDLLHGVSRICAIIGLEPVAHPVPVTQ